jgi:hypothetical protein
MADTTLARRAWTLCLCLVVWLVGFTAAAQPAGVDEEQGRDLAVQAMTHYKNGEFKEALQLFDQAREVYPTGQVLRMSGYTHMALEHWLEAADRIEESLKTTFKPLSDEDREHAETQLAKALEHVGAIQVTSSVEGTEVAVDGGDPVPLPHTFRLEAGEHSFIATAPDHDGVQRDETVQAGQTISLELSPTPMEGDAPRPPPKKKPKPEAEESGGQWFAGQGPVGLVTMTLGVSLVAVGIGFGAYGGSLNSAVEENIAAHNATYGPNCSSHRDLCLNDIELINRDGERAHEAQTTGLALGLTGGALAVGGFLLFLFSEDGIADPPADRADKAVVRCAPAAGELFAGLGCAGSF